jgi:hypothetical protein
MQYTQALVPKICQYEAGDINNSVTASRKSSRTPSLARSHVASDCVLTYCIC